MLPRLMITFAIPFALLAGACGADQVDLSGPGTGSPPPTSQLPAPAARATTAAPIASTVPTEPTEPTEGYAVETVYRQVPYYGACGNEILAYNGTTWYPLHGDRLTEITDQHRPLAASGMVGLVGVRVSPPGPGDDIGTLTVYTDGIARFDSDSGWVIWLTTQVVTYDWEC